MEFIILNRPKDTPIYLQTNRILALELHGDGTTWVHVGHRYGYGLRVLETPEQIIELINQLKGGD